MTPSTREPDRPVSPEPARTDEARSGPRSNDASRHGEPGANRRGGPSYDIPGSPGRDGDQWAGGKLWGTSTTPPTGPLHLADEPTDVQPVTDGGWGAPGHAELTGPIPRLRGAGRSSSDSSTPSAGQERGATDRAGVAPPPPEETNGAPSASAASSNATGHEAEDSTGTSPRCGATGDARDLPDESAAQATEGADDTGSGKPGRSLRDRLRKPAKGVSRPGAAGDKDHSTDRAGSSDKHSARPSDERQARLPAPEADTTWHLSGARFGDRPSGKVTASSTGFSSDRTGTGADEPFVYAKYGAAREQQAHQEAEARRRTPPGEVGAWSLTDLTFRVRSTRALAPIVYIAALIVLVTLYIMNVYTVAMGAATGNASLVDLILTIVIGLAGVILGGALTRLVLEFFCNVADIAARYTERSEGSGH